MITERQLTEEIRGLRKPATRDASLAALLDMLADIMSRSGWRPQAEKIRRIAQDIHTAGGAQDTSGLGHGTKPKPLFANVAARHLQRSAGEGG